MEIRQFCFIRWVVFTPEAFIAWTKPSELRPNYLATASRFALGFSYAACLSGLLGVLALLIYDTVAFSTVLAQRYLAVVKPNDHYLDEFV